MGNIKITKTLCITAAKFQPLDKEFLDKVKTNEPMLHCKINIPPYIEETKKKFDINWEQGRITQQWKMFWWKQRIKKDIERNKDVG